MIDNSIVQLIGSVGFPIVVCLMMMYFYKDLMTKILEAIQRMTESVNNNTNVISNLVDRLGDDK